MNATTNITSAQVSAMMAEQDSAAKAFWAYPDAAWQASFQEQWLLKNVGVCIACGENGLFYGADE